MQMKKILFVIAKEGFRDEEYFVPKEIFENNEIKVVTASTKKGVASGSLGRRANVDIAISDVNISEYDALAIAGGPGALKLKNDSSMFKLIKDAAAMGKILAAICIAPVILAEAGVLFGKKASVWNSDEKPAEILKKHGAFYTGMPNTTDKNIITANGPLAAKKFGIDIVNKLKEQ